jgi:hypothetical protein
LQTLEVKTRVMSSLGLFEWWAICISSSIAFLTLASIYIYVDSKGKEKKRSHAKTLVTFPRDFIFVWVLFGLLALYIVSIDIGSAILFAAGNIFTEMVLVLYTVKNRTRTEKP